VTSYAEITASPTTTPESFLQNGPLEGGVFALVGIVILIIIFVIITFTIRRRRRNRLDRAVADAVTFDPSVAEHYIDEENRMTTAEKHRFSGSSSGHGHGFGYTPQLPYAAPAPAHYAYYDQNQGYEPQAAYPVPLPQVPVNNQDNAVVANTGGANLTRKYSDRKPVPPLLPNPVYDPSRSPVLPSHYYDQENLPPGIALSSNLLRRPLMKRVMHYLITPRRILTQEYSRHVDFLLNLHCSLKAVCRSLIPKSITLMIPTSFIDTLPVFIFLYGGHRFVDSDHVFLPLIRCLI
jgi:hypothetical protein